MKIGTKLYKPGEFKDRLKEIMALKKMTQADLARATGLNKGGISNYVTGRYKPKSEIIKKLALALGCSEAWLQGYDVPMRPPYDYTQIEEGPQGTMMVISESPWEEEMMGYFATLDPDEQYAEVQRIKDISNGKLAAGSPGAVEISEGEKLLLELFRKVPEDRQELVLGMIKAAIENLSK